MQITLTRMTQAAIGAFLVGYAAQTLGGFKLIKANEDLLKANEINRDIANRMAYISMYYLVKLEENDIELTEFDQRVLADPPLLDDPVNPNLFNEYLEYCAEHGFSEDGARHFFNALKAAREGEDPI